MVHTFNEIRDTNSEAQPLLAGLVKDLMRDKGLTKKDVARLLRTSRKQVDRLLDGYDSRVLLETVLRAASFFGYKFSVTAA